MQLTDPSEIVVTYLASCDYLDLDPGGKGEAWVLHTNSCYVEYQPIGSDPKTTPTAKVQFGGNLIEMSKLYTSPAPTAAIFTLQRWTGQGYEDYLVLNADHTPDGKASYGYLDEHSSSLAPGKYKLIETSVPRGFEKMEDLEFEVSIVADSFPSFLLEITPLDETRTDFVVEPYNSSGYFVDVINHPLPPDTFPLPETGGPGTTILYGLAVTLTFSGAALLRKKRSRQR